MTPRERSARIIICILTAVSDLMLVIYLLEDGQIIKYNESLSPLTALVAVIVLIVLMSVQISLILPTKETLKEKETRLLALARAQEDLQREIDDDKAAAQTTP